MTNDIYNFQKELQTLKRKNEKYRKLMKETLNFLDFLEESNSYVSLLVVSKVLRNNINRVNSNERV